MYPWSQMGEKHMRFIFHAAPLFQSLLDSCLSLCCELTMRALPLLPLLHCVDTILTAGVVRET